MDTTMPISSARRIDRGIEATTSEGQLLRVEVCTERVIRVRISSGGQFTPGGLERYGFVDPYPSGAAHSIAEDETGWEVASRACSLHLRRVDGRMSFRAGELEVLCSHGAPWTDAGGFGARFGLAPDERFTGLGDQTRDRIEHRGHGAQMWVSDVTSYTPIPLLVSSQGYGVFANSTWRHYLDLGSSSDAWWGLAGRSGALDLFLIYGPDQPTILGEYTAITGRPYIPPVWSFGLWYICHTDADARAMLDECLRFRDRGIPCDVVGLEPGWMERNYDFSVDKRWHPERFSIPPYCLDGPHNFLNAVRRMGFRPMLWLCCDYDVSEEEERRLAPEATEPVPEDGSPATEIIGAYEVDEHLVGPRWMDTQTRRGEAWFEHLSRFVDQGVELFKQDGANQVLEHPDRKWANGMDDEEMHNLYPLLYSKQMHLDFRAHTGRRATCFTPCGYAGLQRWTGTWAGDTGGGPRPLVSMLNLSLSGHSLMTCDMEVTTKEGIHFGFLQPWVQLNNWNYWRQPWYQGSELEDVFRHYAELRYQMIPYIYTMAHIAHRTGMPILRAMPLMFPEDATSYELLTEYMLGDSLLVSAYADSTYLPAGKWVDYWTGETLQGPQRVPLDCPRTCGGGLFMKAGGIMPAQGIVDYLDCEPVGVVDLQVAPGTDGQGLLVEDDGITYAYEDGRVCETRFRWTEDGNTWRLQLGAPQGLLERVPKDRIYRIEVFGAAEPLEVRVDGTPIRETQEWAEFSHWEHRPLWGARPLVVTVCGDAHDSHEVEITMPDA